MRDPRLWAEEGLASLWGLPAGHGSPVLLTEASVPCHLLPCEPVDENSEPTGNGEWPVSHPGLHPSLKLQENCVCLFARARAHVVFQEEGLELEHPEKLLTLVFLFIA